MSGNQNRKQMVITNYFKNNPSSQQDPNVLQQETTESTERVPCQSLAPSSSSGSNNHEREPENIVHAIDISLDKDSPPVQPRLKSFPQIEKHGQIRRFNSTWYDKYKWLEYSVAQNAIFCYLCRHFGTQISSFTTGFQDWKHLSEKLSDHFLSEHSSHQTAVEKHFMYIQSRKTGSIACLVNSHHKDTVLKNKNVLATHVQVIILCAQQDIALRGHREHDDTTNAGNFNAILKLLTLNCPEFAANSASMPLNAKYTHHSIQNEIINISGNLVRNMIMEEIKKDTECYSVIADESKDNGGTEQLSVCVRYVNDSSISERFIGLLDLHKFDAKSITTGVKHIITAAGLSLKNCVSQSYDGANVMSGDIAGVHAYIEEEVGGLCPYVHCYAHRLNLVLVDCCEAIPEVRNLLGLLQAIYNFQSNSPRRSEFFERAQSKANYKVILKLPKSCDTRWSSKKKGISYFKSRFDAVLKAIEQIITSDGKPDEAAECRGYIQQLRDFKTVVLLCILDCVLSTTNALSEYLQYSQLIYSRAVTLCKSTSETLAKPRNSDKFQELWEEAAAIATKANVEIPSTEDTGNKRIKIQSKKLQDMAVLSTTGYREQGGTHQIRRRIYFQVIDKFVAEMGRRLTSNEDIARGVSASDPEPTNKSFLNQDDVLSFCESFSRFDFNLPSLKSQIPVARNLLRAEKIDRVLACYSYLYSMKSSFPDLWLYYKIVVSIPVSTASGELSFSSLNRIKTFLRTKSGQSRTSNLTQLSIERDLSDTLFNNPSIVVDKFGNGPNRKIDFTL